jgi:cellobiose phosphorylase
MRRGLPMPSTTASIWTTPRDADLGLLALESPSGLVARVLPNGCLFALEHVEGERRIMLNQVLGSPLGGSIGRIVLRRHGPAPAMAVLVGPGVRGELGADAHRIVWTGRDLGIGWTVTLALAPDRPAWLWRVTLERHEPGAATVDVLMAQDLGLGHRGFLMSNEAFASQYIDHHIEQHPTFGPVVMSRQALAQDGRYPWVALACLEGAASFATDALQLFGPRFRDAAGIDPTLELPSRRLQHEVACVALRTAATPLRVGEAVGWTFAGVHRPDHPEASGSADLDVFAGLAAPGGAPLPARRRVTRNLVQDAAPLSGRDLDAATIDRLYPDRRLEEHDGGSLRSFLVAERHVVLAAKDRALPRRHGAILRTGDAVLPDPATMSTTVWMHGVLAAQLTLGNTAFHKLVSVARDPYNIVRGNGLRLFVEIDGRWRLLATPSVFEMGLSDVVWQWHLADRTIVAALVAAGDEPAMTWTVRVDGPPCRFLVLAHLVIGERELDHASIVEVDPARVRASFRPDPGWLWGQRHPEAVLHLVTATPDAVEALGGDELLDADGIRRGTGHLVVRSGPTRQLVWSIVGRLDDPAAATALAERHAQGVGRAAMLAPAQRFWATLSRGIELAGTGPGVAAISAALPWLIHDGLIHLSVPRGLEQYTGAAWGTRDVCQGPVELLLALQHDAPVKEILRLVLAEQSETGGDWPQWFMHEPYAFLRDRHAHGDVIIWPLKALCDYLEATGDLAFLAERLPWRDPQSFARTAQASPVREHVTALIAAVRERFVPGTALIRYGQGDWNDSLQPADPSLRDRLVSSWTVALLWQQLGRWAAIQDRAGDRPGANETRALAAAIAADVERHLIRDGQLAGYALFGTDGDEPELLMHPTDRRTGLRISLIPITRSIIAGLLTGDAARHHWELVNTQLRDPDGVRLMDRPPRYRGGIETIFRRAESAAYCGREIGLMYVHAHLRYAEAAAVLGDADSLWWALRVVDPIGLRDVVPNASPRQRNTYFSSSDPAFPDRYIAGERWAELHRGGVPVEGGWRVYSSGPGLYLNALIRHGFGIRRSFGTRTMTPLLPASLGRVTLCLTVDGRPQSWTVQAET